MIECTPTVACTCNSSVSIQICTPIKHHSDIHIHCYAHSYLRGICSVCKAKAVDQSKCTLLRSSWVGLCRIVCHPSLLSQSVILLVQKRPVECACCWKAICSIRDSAKCLGSGPTELSRASVISQLVRFRSLQNLIPAYAHFFAIFVYTVSAVRHIIQTRMFAFPCRYPCLLLSLLCVR